MLDELRALGILDDTLVLVCSDNGASAEGGPTGTTNEAQFFKAGSDRAYSRIRSTRVTEIADAGTPQERAKPAGEENGFMWRLNTYWRFLDRDGGTYIQCESLTLSRDVPFALAWIIRPFVTQLPKESLTFTLEKARAALSVNQKTKM